MQLVWHRDDLRTHDHPALAAAAEAGATLGIVVLEPARFGAVSARHQALFLANVRALRERYRELGSELLVHSGDPAEVLTSLRPHAVHALLRFTPAARERDAHVEQALAGRLHWHDGRFVRAPGSLRTRAGTPFLVQGAYGRAWREAPAPEPLDPPARIPAPAARPDPGEIPTAVSDVPLPPAGETAALDALRTFLETGLALYHERRDRLDGSGSSRLSIPLATGALSARTAAAAAWHRRGEGARKWLAELSWRDFLADLLHHRPELCAVPYDTRWERFAWRDGEADFAAWREGRTGVPAVDAALRELRTTGWISNRARMVAAQFLSKHLRIDWRKGERVFRDWLLDGELASNVGNWQWAAGMGIDNAPYFRVFNPVTQARTHDPGGEWLRRWVPECGGEAAPLPGAIVDLAAARREYLAAAEEIR